MCIQLYVYVWYCMCAHHCIFYSFRKNKCQTKFYEIIPLPTYPPIYLSVCLSVCLHTHTHTHTHTHMRTTIGSHRFNVLTTGLFQYYYRCDFIVQIMIHKRRHVRSHRIDRKKKTATTSAYVFVFSHKLVYKHNNLKT